MVQLTNGVKSNTYFYEETYVRKNCFSVSDKTVNDRNGFERDSVRETVFVFYPQLPKLYK